MKVVRNRTKSSKKVFDKPKRYLLSKFGHRFACRRVLNALIWPFTRPFMAKWVCHKNFASEPAISTVINHSMAWGTAKNGWPPKKTWIINKFSPGTFLFWKKPRLWWIDESLESLDRDNYGPKYQSSLL